ncbi:Homocysteine S-methyltransferase 1 [Phlyctochytrium planicorne]|nr:Homocysteine S-methyltransferase 1 [Phlyctochytrium planicorne]
MHSIFSKLRILDGGLASELENDGKDLSGKLWSARLITEDPGAIEKVHLKYLLGGADIIITSSYQASIPGFKDLGMTEEKSAEVLHASTKIAKEAVEKFMEMKDIIADRPLIAASLGSYGAYLANGSEYTGNFSGIHDTDLTKFHLEKLKILEASKPGMPTQYNGRLNTFPDIFAFETIPSLQEARCISQALKQLDSAIPAWVSFHCSSRTTVGAGDTIETCLEELELNPSIVAVGVNCTDPAIVEDIIKTMKKGNKAVIAYPNSGEVWDGINKKWLEEETKERTEGAPTDMEGVYYEHPLPSDTGIPTLEDRLQFNPNNPPTLNLENTTATEFTPNVLDRINAQILEAQCEIVAAYEEMEKCRNRMSTRPKLWSDPLFETQPRDPKQLEQQRAKRNKLRRVEILLAEIASLEAEIKIREHDLASFDDKSYELVYGELMLDLDKIRDDFVKESLPQLNMQIADLNEQWESLEQEKIGLEGHVSSLTSFKSRLSSSSKTEAKSLLLKKMKEKKSLLNQEVERLKDGLLEFLSTHFPGPQTSNDTDNPFVSVHSLLEALISIRHTEDPYITIPTNSASATKKANHRSQNISQRSRQLAQHLLQAQVAEEHSTEPNKIRLLPFHE